MLIARVVIAASICPSVCPSITLVSHASTVQDASSFLRPNSVVQSLEVHPPPNECVEVRYMALSSVESANLTNICNSFETV